MKLSRLPNLILLFALVVPLLGHAETKTLTAEATYTMGDGEMPSFAEAMAIQKAKQMALEHAGTYVESYTKVQNLNLTTEEIQTIAGGVLQVEVLDKSRTLIGDGVRFYVKIKATVTTDNMEELAQRIKGKNVAEEYAKLKKDYASLTEEIESVKQLIGKSTPGPERDAALVRIQAKEQSFTELQRKEAAFFQRVVSGSSLVQSARDEKALIDDIVQAITRQKVEIGEIISKAVLDGTGDVQIIVPLTVSLTDSEVERLRATVKALRGSVQGIAFSEINSNIEAVNFLSFRGERFRSFVRAIRVSFFDDQKVEDFLRDQVQKAVLQVSFLGKDGSALAACSVPAPLVGMIFNAPLVAEDRLQPEDAQLAVRTLGYINYEKYAEQSQDLRALRESEASFGPLDEKYKEDFRWAGTGPLSSMGGLSALFHRAELYAKINTMPSGPERLALEKRLNKLETRLNLLDKLHAAYEKEYGGEFYRLYAQETKSRYEGYKEKSILGDENARETLRREFPWLVSIDDIVIARDAGKAVLSVKAPTEFVGRISQVTARFELGGTSEADSLLQALYKDKSPRQKEALGEIIRRWHRLTSEDRTKLSKVFREKGMIPLQASVSDSNAFRMNADWHRGIFCGARAVATE